jgi:hypothetical protein
MKNIRMKRIKIKFDRKKTQGWNCEKTNLKNYPK